MADQFEEPMKLDDIVAKTEKYVLHTYNRAPVSFFFGQGELLFDTDHKRYIDFVTGIAVCALGHGEADYIEAMRSQADRLIHTSNLFYNQEQALLAEVIIENSYPGKVFFCNSGTEANEAAFKIARSFGQQKGDGANTILSITGSFHGRTTAAMVMTGQEKIHTGFGPLVPHTKYLAPNDVVALERELDENGHDVAALFMELVQGEGGVHPMDQDYVKAVRELTKEYNVMLVFDEIQTGIGRTGSLFAYEHYDVEPDVMTLAKALGNGFPIGAMVVAEDFVDYLKPGMHGSTFGGNHLASRVAYETIRVIMTREILKNVNTVSEYVFSRLHKLKEELSIIKKVRGIGLHIGVELKQPCAKLVELCRDKGLLVNCTAGSTIRLLPPLNVSIEITKEALDILEGVLRELNEKP